MYDDLSLNQINAILRFHRNVIHRAHTTMTQSYIIEERRTAHVSALNTELELLAQAHPRLEAIHDYRNKMDRHQSNQPARPAPL